MDKHPKRRKDKYNPYTLSTESGKYYILFIDVNNHIQKVELSKKLFDSFNKFELEDISQMNEYDRHYEHFEVYEKTLNKKNVAVSQSLEEHFEEKTFDEIALEEGCTYQSIQRSVYRAVAKIKSILENL